MTTGQARLRQPFLFVGNHLCLDFINTQMIVQSNPTDLLGGCEDLVTWLVQASVMDKVQAALVMTQWSHKDQEQLFEQGIRFRGTLREMAKRLVARKSIPHSAVAFINQVLSRCPGYPQLVYKKEGFTRQFQPQAAQKDCLLAPLAERLALFRQLVSGQEMRKPGLHLIFL